MRADSGQCLKRDHHRNATQSPAAAALTKSKRKLKLIHNFFWWKCHYLHIPPSPLCHFLSFILGNPVPTNIWMTPSGLLWSQILSSKTGESIFCSFTCFEAKISSYCFPSIFLLIFIMECWDRFIIQAWTLCTSIAGSSSPVFPIFQSCLLKGFFTMFIWNGM